MQQRRSKTGLYLWWYILIISGCFLSGCTAMKYVPDDRVLYTGAEVDVVSQGRVGARKRVKELLTANVLPEPNTTILGMRPGLWFFYVAGEPRKKGLRRFMKNKLGQAPVYMSDIDPSATAQLLRAHLVNNGYFQSEVSAEESVKGKKGTVTYTANVHRPYRIRNISYPRMDTLFMNIDSVRSDAYVKVGQRYNLERLDAELQRVEEALENLGYFYFDDRHLIFEADSTVGDKKIDLTLTLEPGVPEKATRIYRLGKIYVYPDYNLGEDTVVQAADTLLVDGLHYINSTNAYRPQTITRVINFRPNGIYRTLDREYTLRHLMSLSSFKFVDIRFQEASDDSARLDTRIYLTPHLRKSLRAELRMVSKSNSFAGPGLELRFTNRNFLGGSEQFHLTGDLSYEVQISSRIPNPLTSVEFGITSGLSVPRIIAPFYVDYHSRRYLPTTEFSLGYRVQRRINYFHLNSFNLSAGYRWRENRWKSHELYPIDISYVQLGNTSSEFNQLLRRNPFLEAALQDQFIPGTRYSYTLNTQVDEQRINEFSEVEFDRSHFYFNGKVDIAGNLLNLLKRTAGADGDRTRIFGQTYSQFVRGEIDVRHYYNLDRRNMLVTRLNIGAGYAYGNVITMPYTKQFSIGGPTSIRAFQARTVGPGTHNIFDTLPDESSEDEPGIPFFIDQRADLKLEGNIEYRFDIVGFLKGAWFADAGNIWLMRNDTERPGGKFDKKTFIDELAVGTGIGLRFDFNFFLLRFDVAFPVRKPWLPENERWVFNQIDLASPSWRSDNLILNIAIGYPF